MLIKSHSPSQDEDPVMTTHLLRLTGAELIEVPAVPYKDPNNYVK